MYNDIVNNLSDYTFISYDRENGLKDNKGIGE
jgi:hypothetical protein